MESTKLNYKQGIRNIYYPNSVEHMKCSVIKRVSNGQMWEKKISSMIYNDCIENECAIDIGANIGTHTISMLDGVSPNGLVIAFEPQTDIADCLVFTLKDVNKSNKSKYTTGNFVISKNLVSNKNERKVFYSDGTGRSRIPIKGARYIKEWKKTLIQTTTIDSFLSKNSKYQNKSKRICLLKIDVEGHEFEVLDGAKLTIKINKPIIYIEVWDKDGDYAKLVNWSKNHHYKINRLTPNDYRLIPL